MKAFLKRWHAEFKKDKLNRHVQETLRPIPVMVEELGREKSLLSKFVEAHCEVTEYEEAEEYYKS